MDDERFRDASQVAYGELPELTRGLRALGSARHDTRSLQSVFFLPLLEALKKAASAREAEGRVRAFDAAELRRQLDRVIERIVGEWRDERPSARRAVRAQLIERVAPYADALRVLGDAAVALRDADQAGRLDSWRAWTLQLASVFASADRCWIALHSAASALPPRPIR